MIVHVVGDLDGEGGLLVRLIVAGERLPGIGRLKVGGCEPSEEEIEVITRTLKDNTLEILHFLAVGIRVGGTVPASVLLDMLSSECDGQGVHLVLHQGRGQGNG